MATAKMETAAEKYRRKRQERANAQELQEVVCPDCQMDWKARRVGIDFWVTSGVLPSTLVEKMMQSIQKTGSGEEVIKTLAAHEVVQSIEFANKVVLTTAAEPRIVPPGQEAPDAITQDELLTCCYKTLLNWQMHGGDEAARLSNFP